MQVGQLLLVVEVLDLVEFLGVQLETNTKHFRLVFGRFKTFTILWYRCDRGIYSEEAKPHISDAAHRGSEAPLFAGNNSIPLQKMHRATNKHFSDVSYATYE